ncbi:ABC transporter ATP-binding protein [Novosphingobium sp. FSW06-99]|uniref:ABC transporter ATP-binding protein n=1 Tax=Novosphingobium sp. FSW06-99 TaxID=1739113 RepID=UPI00076DA9A4|nr:ABC transporter ATP-binding protein [Novosphingobium sp. FSW06-99]KUR79850.1 ABC transporter ATP-binding protein [Novosphingobium sp. FSW06-99]
MGDPDRQSPTPPGRASDRFISVRNVAKRFGSFTAVDGVSLDIGKGELFALLGSSGCGKTTLLRMLAGFEQPSSGQIFIDGEDMAGIAPYHRPVNMMFQSYALFPHMTVEKNIGYGLKHERMAKSERDDRVAAMLDLVQLRDFARRHPHQLSGGQRQRVALARALAKQPKLLLLDEPLGALDKKLREQTQFEIANIQYETGITFVVVTHDQEEAMTLASRIAIMDRGAIRQLDTPKNVYEFPGSRFVASFIGSVNLFDGELVRIDGDFADVAVPDLGITLRALRRGDLRGKGRLTCAFRPEKVHMSRQKPDGMGNTIQGVVLDFGYFGKDSLYRIKMATQALVRVNATNDLRAGDDEIVATWEDEVYLSIDPKAIMIFEDEA